MAFWATNIRPIRVGQDIGRSVDRRVGKELIVVPRGKMVFRGNYLICTAQHIVEILVQRR
jgi:hypothetical protein